MYVGGASIHMGDDVVLSASNGSLNATNSLGSTTLLSAAGFNGGMLAGFGTTSNQDGGYTAYYNSNSFLTTFLLPPVVVLSPLNLYVGSGTFTSIDITTSNVNETGFYVYSSLSNAQYSWLALPRTFFPGSITAYSSGTDSINYTSTAPTGGSGNYTNTIEYRITGQNNWINGGSIASSLTGLLSVTSYDLRMHTVDTTTNLTVNSPVVVYSTI
jgi:hypothetical protein